MAYDLRQGIIETANAIGLPPADLAAIISYESGFNPDVWGGAGGKHYGLIQFGPQERADYGVVVGDVSSQLGANGAIARYFKDRGFKPGMGLLDAYSTVNAGRPGLYSAMDAHSGGLPGTVQQKVSQQFTPHQQKAAALLGGDYTPTADASSGAFTNFTNTVDDPLAELYEPQRRSQLSDDLAASVSGSRRQQSSEGGNGLLYGAVDQETSQPMQFDFGDPTSQPEPGGQSPPASVAPSSSDQPLADLFKVKDIGQASMTDPRTGVSLVGRRRRSYG